MLIPQGAQNPKGFLILAWETHLVDALNRVHRDALGTTNLTIKQVQNILNTVEETTYLPRESQAERDSIVTYLKSLQSGTPASETLVETVIYACVTVMGKLTEGDGIL